MTVAGLNILTAPLRCYDSAAGAVLESAYRQRRQWCTAIKRPLPQSCNFCQRTPHHIMGAAMLTIEEIAADLRVSKRHAYELVRQETFPRAVTTTRSAEAERDPEPHLPKDALKPRGPNMRTWKQWKDRMKDHLNPKRAYARGHRAGRKLGLSEAAASALSFGDSLYRQLSSADKPTPGYPYGQDPEALKKHD